jgi:hypothetical protein
MFHNSVDRAKECCTLTRCREAIFSSNYKTNAGLEVHGCEKQGEGVQITPSMLMDLARPLCKGGAQALVPRESCVSISDREYSANSLPNGALQLSLKSNLREKKYWLASCFSAAMAGRWQGKGSWAGMGANESSGLRLATQKRTSTVSLGQAAGHRLKRAFDGYIRAVKMGGI